MDNKLIKVLLIDDDEDDYLLTQELLADSAGSRHTLDWEPDFDKGMQAIGHAGHDVYLIDYRLGAHNGLELLQAARRSNYNAALILLTGAGSLEVDKAAMEAGAADFLVKAELTPPLLERSIRYAIRHVQTLAALRASEQRYAAAVNAANDGLWDWNLETGEVYYSPRWKAILGYHPHELGDDPEEWLSRVHPEDQEQLRRDLDAHFADELHSFVNEHRLRHCDGYYLWVLSRGLMMRDEEGRSLRRVAGSLTDVSERKHAQEQLLHDALHDGLTRLPNRNLFMNRLEHVFGRRTRHPEERCAVLFLDLDRFKVINDSLGHVSGDLLLMELARRLAKNLRSADTVARLGGDEFAVLLEDVQSTDVAREVAKRLDSLVRQPVRLEGHEINVTASIGVALNDPEHNRPEELMRDADIAMYHAKAQGRGQYAMFDRQMYTQAAERMRLENDLRRALEQNEFLLQYQPIVALDSGQVIGFEALVRWQHPERGRISPLAFIPIAEETGLILPLGWWILEQACRDLRLLQARCPQCPLTMSVNLAARQFAQPDLVERIARVLDQIGLDPHRLILEITESTMMEGSSATTTRLEQIRNLGVRCYVDDFGTGYSSLSYLHRFPIAALKVDRSFVNNMIASSEHLAIVETIIVLAHTLGMKIVAEGVESADQITQLRRLGCEYAQGYQFAPPLDREAAGRLLVESGQELQQGVNAPP